MQLSHLRSSCANEANGRREAINLSHVGHMASNVDLDEEVASKARLNAAADNHKLKQCGNWSNVSLHHAMDVVTNQGLKLKATAQIFGIPTTSKRDHLYGKTHTRQRGNLPMLGADEEKKLFEYIFKI